MSIERFKMLLTRTKTGSISRFRPFESVEGSTGFQTKSPCLEANTEVDGMTIASIFVLPIEQMCYIAKGIQLIPEIRSWTLLAAMGAFQDSGYLGLS